MRTEFPPIIVHRATMRVIDGVHRLRVAKLRGQEKIAVRFFEGDAANAFVLAVQSNVTHGLPLSLADRKRAAVRISLSHPEWSNRKIASVTGLSGGTVAEIRSRRSGETPSTSIRIGPDGRVRPVDHASGRLLVQRADPLPNGQTRSGPEGESRTQRVSADQSAAIVERLRADPALRVSETGRNLLRLLNVATLGAEERDTIIDNVPAHCSGVIVQVAKACAGIWEEFAARAERKATDMSTYT